MKDEILVLVKEPGSAPAPKKIPNTLKAMQGLVEGFIETMPIAKDAVVICNEEGWLRQLPSNYFQGRVWAGTVFLAGIDGDEFTDAPERYIRR